MSIAGFYSDPHFGHANILKFCERPFTDLAHMHQSMVHRYNAKVGLGDLMLWMGDAFMKMSERHARQLLAEMNGHKAIVMGNHDRSAAWLARVGFDIVMDTCTLWMAGRKVRCSHYPYAGTSKRGGRVDTRHEDKRLKPEKGTVLLHGHTHDRTRRNGSQVHVGVDAWDYGPAMWADVEALVAQV